MSFFRKNSEWSSIENQQAAMRALHGIHGRTEVMIEDVRQQRELEMLAENQWDTSIAGEYEQPFEIQGDVVSEPPKHVINVRPLLAKVIELKFRRLG